MKLILKDQNIIELKDNSTALDAAKKISTSLSKKSLFAICSGNVIDLLTPIKLSKANFEIITDKKNPYFVDLLNHSCAHLMAAAIKNLFPFAKFAIGPAINEGFYYDIDFGKHKISENDLVIISKEMNKLIKNNPKFERDSISKEDALKLFKNNEYKQEIISGIDDDLSIYKIDNFIDLCRGPHVLESKYLKNFKILSIAGAYWKGDSKNKMLTRIYGTCHPTPENLSEHLKILQLRKERDHRKIGQKLELFTFDLLAGQGLPIWLPNGMIIKEELRKYLHKVELKYGFSHVSTPILGSIDLYKTSGHYFHFKDEMYPEIKNSNETLMLRPMSCPHHCLIYKYKLRSYRNLPLRISEDALQYRNESSGSLTGLERVRGMSLTDAHVFVDFDNLESEIKHLLNLIQEVLITFEIKIKTFRLSLRNPQDKISFFDNDSMWNKAESILRNSLINSKLPFKESIGEAAFYGPKIDIQVQTILGHEITISTLQLDFLLPERFDLKYKDKNSKFSRPVMLHRGLIGTYERFLSILLEQTNGNLPLWLSPVQVILIPVHEKFLGYCNDINNKLKENDIRSSINIDDERISYKIRNAQIKKIPYQIIIGENEFSNNTLEIREFGKEKSYSTTLNNLLSKLTKEINSKKKIK